MLIRKVVLRVLQLEQQDARLGLGLHSEHNYVFGTLAVDPLL